MQAQEITLSLEDALIVKAALRAYIEKKARERRQYFRMKNREIKFGTESRAEQILAKIDDGNRSTVAPSFVSSRVACV